MKKMPSIFISHGPPSIVLTDLPVTRFFENLSHMVQKPRAILVISAHFEAAWPLVTTAAHMTTIHDFSGPMPLFSLQYPVNGDTELAEQVISMFMESGINAAGERQRGLDHGAWIPLLLAYPEKDIPVIQLSVETNESPIYHYELGKIIAPLRDQGVLIMGSGGAVHNLDDVYNYDIDSPPSEYATAFDYWLELAINGGTIRHLLDYEKSAPYSALAHPYPAEHFLPLFVSLGAAGSGSRGLTIHKSFLYGSLSMAAYLWE